MTLRVGNIVLDGSGLFPDKEKKTYVDGFYEKLFEGMEITMEGLHAIGEVRGLKVSSPVKYPKFTFLIDIKKMPIFLQVGKGLAALSTGVFFIDSNNEDISSSNGYVTVKKLKGGLYKITLNRLLEGEYYTDGKRLWSASFGKNRRGIDRILKDNGLIDFVFIKGKSHIVGIDKEGKYRWADNNQHFVTVSKSTIDERIKIVIGDKSFWAPKYYEMFMFQRIISLGWYEWW